MKPTLRYQAAKAASALLPGLLALCVCAAVTLVARQPPVPETADRAAAAAVQPAVMPLAFEPNVGQTQPWVDYLARGPGYALALDGGNARLLLQDGERTQMLGLDLLDARAVPAQAQAPQGGVSHYLSANAEQTHRNVARYGRVRYNGVWEGVDVAWYGNAQNQLEYDFIVAPHADPQQIALAVRNATPQLQADGSLKLALADGGSVLQHPPVSYQNVAGVRRPVESRWDLRDDGALTIALADYDRSLPLTIDPILAYGSYLGGSNPAHAYTGASSGLPNEYVTDAAVDFTGSLLVTGITPATDFPTTAGSYDTRPMRSSAGTVFVAKFNDDASGLVYATYLDGNSATNAVASALAIPAGSRSVVVTGVAGSANFPTTDAVACVAGQAFITRLDITGSALVFSRCIGTGLPGGLALDAAGDVYVAGTKSPSGGFPTSVGAFDTSPNGVEDGFIYKASGTSGAMIYSTLLGGTGRDFLGSFSGFGNALAVDAAGNAYVVGHTGSADFPTSATALDRSLSGDTDLFVSKLSADGTALLYSTYLGGSNREGWTFGNAQMGAIVVNAAGEATIGSTTDSNDYPTTATALDRILNADGTVIGTNDTDMVLSRLNANGSALLASTYLGGGDCCADRIYDLKLRQDGSVVVVGGSNSSGFPTTAGALRRSFVVTYDNVALSVLPADFSRLIYSSYLGAGTAMAVALNASEQVYIAGYGDTEIPTTANALKPGQDTNARGDGFALKLLALRDSVTDLIDSDFFITEGAGPATITANRTGSNEGSFQVDYTVTLGTAQAADATLVTGTLHWADGESGNKSFAIPIADDATVEAAETLLVSLSQPNGRLGVQHTATVTIQDNDSSAPPSDTTPDAFAFNDVSGAARNSSVVSNSITVSGINAAAPISISGGDGVAYSIGCTGSFTNVSGSINNGQTVCVRVITEGSASTASDALLTIGGVSDTFTVTTSADATPPPPPPAPAPAPSQSASGSTGGGGAFGLGLLPLALLALRRHRRSAAAALLLAPAITLAEVPPLSLSVAVGQARHAIGNDDLSRGLQQRGFAHAATLESDDLAYRIAASVWPQPYWGVELGLAQHGDYAIRSQGRVADRAALTRAAAESSVHGAGPAFTLALRWRSAEWQSLRLEPQLGVFHAFRRTRLADAAGESRVRSQETGLMLGAQLLYALTPQLALGVGGDLLAVPGHDSLTQIQGVLRWDMRPKAP